jgi:KUP system potassium uptake protein
MELSESAKEAMFLRYLLRDIQLTQTKPTVLLEDNQSAIALSNSAITNNRTKHIDIKYHFVREKVLTSDVRVEYCPTEFMLADVFTKPLAAPRHAMLCKAIMG